jgi:hypothetical protein
MRQFFVPGLLVSLLLASNTLAQQPGPEQPRLGEIVPAPSEPAQLLVAPDARYDDVFFKDRTRPLIWGGAELLLWRIQGEFDMPPLVTTGNPRDAFPGALGQPGTRVLFGGEQHFGAANTGLRATVGGWILGDLSWEANGFLFEPRWFSFFTSSNAAGNPPLYLTQVRAETGRPDSFFVAEPFNPVTGTGGFNGSVLIAADSRFWGQETNLLYDLGEFGPWRCSLIGGFRYLDLKENLTINTFINDFIFEVQQDIQDSFATHSRFYGGQLGFKTSANPWRNLTVDFTGKLALGSNYNVFHIAGRDTLSGFGFGDPFTFNTEGIYTQTSNVGLHAFHDFSIVPAFQLKLAYDFFPWLRGTAAYDFLFWSRVARAAEQVDTVVDIRQSVAFDIAPLERSIFPRALVERSNFWAHGVSLGLELRY